MNVVQKESTGLKRSFTVTIPSNEIQEKINVRLQTVANSANLPGFRKGKAPLDIIKKRYKDSIIPEVLEKVANETAFKALDDQKLRPAMRPRIQMDRFKDGEDLTYTIDVEILPEITVQEFKDFKLDKMTATPAETDVDAALQNLAKATRGAEKAEAGYAAQKGDIVVIDFDGSIDGIPRPGMKGDNHSLELGSNSFIPGFEDQLIGAREGDERDVTVTFPADYHATDLAGKEAIFKCKIHEIRVTKDPDTNDDWAKQFGAENLENLKGKISERLQAEYDRASNFKLKRALLDQLADQYDFDVPPSMLESEFRQIWQQVQDEIKRYGKSEEDKDKSDDELQKEYRNIAERRVRLGLLLAEIGRAANVNVNEDELSGALQQELARYPGRGKEIIEFYRNSPGAVDLLRAPIFEQKVVDHILEHTSVTDKSISVEELMKDTPMDDMPMAAHSMHDHQDHGEDGHVHGPDCNH